MLKMLTSVFSKSGSSSIVWDSKCCPLYGVARCPLFRGCLSIEVNGRKVYIQWKLGSQVGELQHYYVSPGSDLWTQGLRNLNL